ncbi:hypothetical protein PILCRDRAFT_743297 [Piloderma croceum F 1598]|uniref:Uncharacterized protein n=1 Tax=Piloderma croceum (strain F 1598) TaxID=765440 RepID=A0A0C3AEQ5_PILCF|nr:hypothetical protein PILCRDRAFT_743297 [Piloderma croceum F 1598]
MPCRGRRNINPSVLEAIPRAVRHKRHRHHLPDRANIHARLGSTLSAKTVSSFFTRNGKLRTTS